MIVEAYGIKLQRLTADDIELVRQHRNSEIIRNTMEYREPITAEMQKKWFESIDNEQNNYMLIMVENHPIGLISGTQIDWERGVTNNGGIFIWDTNYVETVYPARAALLLTDLGFFFGMKKNFVRILRDNLKSISFNLSLGYKLIPNQQNVYNQQYELTPQSYFSNVEKLRPLLGASGIINILITQITHESSRRIVELYKEIPASHKQHVKLNVIG